MAIKIKGITIIPDSVGDSTTTGNTVVGTSALAALTTGTDNIALGVNALFTTTTGSKNIAIGSNALESNTTGDNNIAIGYYSGSSLTTGSNNTIIGNLNVNSGTVNTLLIGTGGTERVKVDDTGLYINGVVFTGGGGVAGASGYSGFSGHSGYSGKSGYSGAAGASGFSGLMGPSGPTGTSGYSGAAGLSNAINATDQTTGTYYIVGVSDTGSMQTASASKTNPLYYDASNRTITGIVTTATNLGAGSTGAIPYQSNSGTTEFLNLTPTLYSVLAAATNSPQYVTQVQVKNGVASSTQSTGQSLVVSSGGAGVTGNSYIDGDLGIANNQVVAGSLQILSTSSNTGTKTSNSLYVAGGAWIDKNLTVEGVTTFKNNVVFQGTATYIESTNTFYTDNLFDLHVNGSPSTPWTLDDGKDIGLIVHYYNASAGRTGFLGLANDTKYLEWYDDGSESGDTFTGTSYGTFKTGATALVGGTNAISTTTGDLRVVGGAGFGGDVYIGGIPYVGSVPSIVELGNPLGVFTADVDNYAQVQIQNLSTGSLASSDFIATANNGTDSTHYIDVGINNSSYNTSTWTMSGANDGYIYVNQGHLTVGTDSAGKTVKVHVGGTLSSNVATTFNSANTNATTTASGTLVVAGGIGASGSVYLGNNLRVVNTVTAVNGYWANTTQVVDSLGNWVGNPINMTFTATVAETAPNTPIAGQLWWDSSTSSGVLKIYYQDTDTAQWIDATPSGSSAAPAVSSSGFEQQFLLMGA